MAETRNIRKHVLENGLVILTEEMPAIRSVCVGIWITTGSRHEDVDESGISHFIEHMVFKGTKRRSAAQIAREMDSIGGNIDAFTGKEMICFNAKVLDDHLPVALDVLSDMVLDPLFDAKDLAREKGVIQEEIKMDEDNPDYLVHETFTQSYWKDHPLGRPILGTTESVRGFDEAGTHQAYCRRFTPGNMIVSAAGRLNHEDFVKQITALFGGLKPGKNGFHQSVPQTFPRVVKKHKKSLEQVQICMGGPSLPMADERRYETYVLNTLLGGGMSSRLFQKVREEQGLVYSIYSDLNAYRDTGCWLVYAGTSRESAAKVIAAVVEELKRLKDEPVPDEEMQRVKNHLKGSMMLGLESSSSRMMNLARQEMYFERHLGLDEMIERIESVKTSAIQELAEMLFRSELLAATILGNLDGVKIPAKPFTL